MPPRITKALVMSSGSVIALYMETILQAYVSVSDTSASPSFRPSVSVVSLCLIGIAFLSTSIASYVLANSSTFFHKDDNDNDDDDNHDDDHYYLKSKIIFKILHLFQFGLVWRIFKMITSFTGSDANRLVIDLRIVHVTLQSLPYITIYTSSCLIKGKITAVQSLSLGVSVLSAASAITCYNLRLKLFTDDHLQQQQQQQQVQTGSLEMKMKSRPRRFKLKFNSTCAVVATFVGTLLVLFSRSASISLMAAQVRLWILVPLSIHFLIILLVFILFSSRSDENENETENGSKSATRMLRVTTRWIFCVGMSFLNSFDLVYDNISHVMCKYVAFYSLLLVENIIFITFWLLNFDLDDVSKLVTVLGILSAFVVGVVVKFAGGTAFSRGDSNKSGHRHQTSEEDLSHCVTDGSGGGGLSSAATPTVASTTLSLAHPSPVARETSDDLITIVQASLALRSQRHALRNSNSNGNHSNNALDNSSTSSTPRPLQQLHVTGSTSRPTSTGRNGNTHENMDNKGKHSSTKLKFKHAEKERRKLTMSKSKSKHARPPHIVLNLDDDDDDNKPYTPQQPSTNPHYHHHHHHQHHHIPEPSRFLSTSTSTPPGPSTDQADDSFQHSSVLSVSDPETLLSDMMYDVTGTAEVCSSCQHTPIIDQSTSIQQQQQRHHQDVQCPHHHPHHISTGATATTTTTPPVPKGRHSNPRPPEDGNRNRNSHRNQNRLQQHLNLNEYQHHEFFNPNHDIGNHGNPSNAHNNESSDNAVTISSAKTYPHNSKSNSKFDREMKNILSSITAGGGGGGGGREGGGGQAHQMPGDPFAHSHQPPTTTPPYRFSDSETVVKTRPTPKDNKPDRPPLRPLVRHSTTDKVKDTTKGCKNLITYAEPADIHIHIHQTHDPITTAGVNPSRRHNLHNAHPRHKNVSSSPLKPANTKGDKIHGADHGHRSHNPSGPAPPPRVIRLCESGSSSFTSTTVTHGNMTSAHTSSTSTMATQDGWHDNGDQSSQAKSERLSQFLLQNDPGRISPSENILRWLSSTTEACHIETV